MFVDTFLLPRFLILELVIACHYLEFANACNVITSSSHNKREQRVDRSQISGNTRTGDSVCRISLWEQGWERSPLFYTGDGVLVFPMVVGRGRGQLVMGSGTALKLACPGGGIGNTGTDEAQVLCDGSAFTYQGEVVSIDSLGCSIDPKEAEIVDEDSYCGPDGRGLEITIGFKLGSTFSPILKLCHSVETEETHWVQHTLKGESIGARLPERGASSFKEGSIFYKSVSANKAYKSWRQKRRFTAQFGKKAVEDYFSSAFDRGHLAPDADFLFEDWKEATYYYANTAPMWHAVNRGNWKAVEHAVRLMAQRGGDDIDVVTGTFSVLKVKRKEVWLSKEDRTKNNLIPVPRVLWKLVRRPETNSSIVFVTLNNPFYKRVTRVQIFCPDVCESSGWDIALDSRKSLEAGYTFCCALEEFKKEVPWVLDQGSNDTLLQYA